MLDLESGVAGGARGWVAGWAGLWGVPPTRVWVVGVSLQILAHPNSICDTVVNWSPMVTSFQKVALHGGQNTYLSQCLAIMVM